MKLSQQRKRILALWNTEQISLFVKQLKSSRMNSNISKCMEFGEWCWFWPQEVPWHPNMAQTILLSRPIITTVLQMRRWNLCWWIGWYPPARLNPSETPSITLVCIPYLSLIYLGIIVTGLCSCWSIYWAETCPNQPHF